MKLMMASMSTDLIQSTVKLVLAFSRNVVCGVTLIPPAVDILGSIENPISALFAGRLYLKESLSLVDSISLGMQL